MSEAPPTQVAATGVWCYLQGANGEKFLASNIWQPGEESETGATYTNIPLQPYQVCEEVGYLSSHGTLYEWAGPLECFNPI